MNPSASTWLYAPWSSSNVTTRIEYRLFGLSRPMQLTLPLYSFIRTRPLTLRWLSSIAACSIRRSGLNQNPL